ncbi:hypothetical protein M2368_003592 [Arthrobacter sp. JUb119]|nr:hypothetical protein [Arthrobacter sp. JUb119]
MSFTKATPSTEPLATASSQNLAHHSKTEDAGPARCTYPNLTGVLGQRDIPRPFKQRTKAFYSAWRAMSSLVAQKHSFDLLVSLDIGTWFRETENSKIVPFTRTALMSRSFNPKTIVFESSTLLKASTVQNFLIALNTSSNTD